MQQIIKIKELCQSNNITKEHAELIVKEIQDVFNINNIHALVFEIVLSFEGITSISLEASTIIRNYIYENKLEKSICLINMTHDVRHRFFWSPDTKIETDMKNTNQKELSKFGKWFLNFMNNKGGAKILVMTGLTSLAIFLGPFFVQTFNLMCSDMSVASKSIVLFGLACVITALVCLIKMIIFVNKRTDFFK